MYSVSECITTNVYTNSSHSQHNKNKIAFFGAPLSNKGLITLQSM